MINLKKASLMAAVGVMLVPAAVFAAENDVRDVVKDARGNIVTSTNGNCVLTRWPAGVDECAGETVKAPVPQPPKRLTLTKEQRTVYFDFNKSTLNTREKTKLDEVSKIITDSKEVDSVDIVGYADMIGNTSYNQKLSTRRAQTVKSYLATKGLRTRNIRVEGLGEANSVTHCDSKLPRTELIACLAEDRRVEIEVNLKQ